MIELLTIAQGVLERGLIFSIMVTGMYLTSRIIKFDDLSIEGSFGLGGAVTAAALLANIPALLFMPLVLLAGAATGISTGLLFTRLKLNNLISGIVVATALFSINLKIAGSNVVLAGKPTIFSWLPIESGKFILLLIPLNVLVIYTLSWFLKTQVGLLVRASGCNAQVLTNVGKNNNVYKTLALALSNACAALTGSLFVQYTGYFSLWSSVGVVIMTLAGLILAEIVSTKFGIALVVGAIAYQAIISLTLELVHDQEWNKLITALLIIALTLLKKHTKLPTMRG